MDARESAGAAWPIPARSELDLIGPLRHRNGIANGLLLAANASARRPKGSGARVSPKSTRPGLDSASERQRLAGLYALQLRHHIEIAVHGYEHMDLGIPHYSGV